MSITVSNLFIKQDSSFNTFADDTVPKIKVDNNGNIYFAYQSAGVIPGKIGFAPSSIVVGKCDPSGNLLWIKQDDTFNAKGVNNTIPSIDLDISNNLILTYLTNGVVPGGTNLVTAFIGSFTPFILVEAPTNDVVICKFDENGNTLWVKQSPQWNTFSPDNEPSVTTDSFGNVYCAYSAQFSAFGTFYGGQNLVLVKLDINGNFIYAKTTGDFNTDGSDVSPKIICDSSNNLVLAFLADNGQIAGGTFTIGVGLPSADIIISKLDLSGNKIWTLQHPRLNTNNNERELNLALDISNNILISASTTGTITGGTKKGNSNIYVAKVDPCSNILWTLQTPSINSTNGDSYSSSLDTDASGNVILIYSNNTFVGSGQIDINMSKIDICGNVLWNKKDSRWNTFAGVEESGNISYSKNKQHFAMTYVSNKYVVPQATQLTNTFDIVVSKFDSNGNIQWSKQDPSLNTNENDVTPQVVVDASNNIYIAYTTNGTIVGGFRRGFTDLVICKLDSLGNKVWARQDASWNTLSEDTKPSLAIDNSGNILFAYMTGGVIRRGTATGTIDVVIGKIDYRGRTQWITQRSDINTEQVEDSPRIYCDSQNNILITYGTTGQVSGGTKTTNGSDVVVAKYDSCGNFVWAKQNPYWNGAIGSVFSGCYYPDIICDPSDNVYFSFVTTEQITGGTFIGGGIKIALIKMDSCGNIVWGLQDPRLYTYAGSADLVGQGGIGPRLATDNISNIYITFSVVSGKAFDGTSVNRNSGGQDVVISRYDYDGVQYWSKQDASWNTFSNEINPYIAYDKVNNGVFITFSTYGQTQGQTLTGGSDIVLTKLAANGQKLWTKQNSSFNTSGDEVNPIIRSDYSGNAIIVYSSNGTIAGGTCYQNEIVPASKDIVIVNLVQADINAPTVTNAYFSINDFTLLDGSSVVIDLFFDVEDEIGVANVTVDNGYTIVDPSSGVYNGPELTSYKFTKTYNAIDWAYGIQNEVVGITTVDTLGNTDTYYNRLRFLRFDEPGPAIRDASLSATTINIRDSDKVGVIFTFKVSKFIGITYAEVVGYDIYEPSYSDANYTYYSFFKEYYSDDYDYGTHTDEPVANVYNAFNESFSTSLILNINRIDTTGPSISIPIFSKNDFILDDENNTTQTVKLYCTISDNYSGVSSVEISGGFTLIDPSSGIVQQTGAVDYIFERTITFNNLSPGYYRDPVTITAYDASGNKAVSTEVFLNYLFKMVQIYRTFEVQELVNNAYTVDSSWNDLNRVDLAMNQCNMPFGTNLVFPDPSSEEIKLTPANNDYKNDFTAVSTELNALTDPLITDLAPNGLESDQMINITYNLQSEYAETIDVYYTTETEIIPRSLTRSRAVAKTTTKLDSVRRYNATTKQFLPYYVLDYNESYMIQWKVKDPYPILNTNAIETSQSAQFYDDYIYLTYTTTGLVQGGTRWSASNPEVVVAKLDPSDGSLVWAKQNRLWNTISNQSFPNIGVNNNFIYLVFASSGTITGGTSRGNFDIIIVKLDLDGNILWTRQNPFDNTAGIDTTPSFDFNSAGDLIIAYRSNSNITGGVNAGNNDIVLLKIDGNTGVRLWIRQDASLNTIGNEDGPKLYIDNVDNIYLTYTTTGTVQGGTRLVKDTTADIVIAKLNSNGIRQWIRQDPAFSINLVAVEANQNIVLDSSNNIYLLYNSGRTIVLAKLDSDGNRLWVRADASWNTTATTATNTANSLIIDICGNIIFTYATTGVISTNAASENNTSDIVLIKVNPSGQILDTFQSPNINTYGTDTNSQIFRNPDNDDLYLTFLTDIRSLDPSDTVVNKGKTDLVVMKLGVNYRPKAPGSTMTVFTPTFSSLAWGYNLGSYVICLTEDSTVLTPDGYIHINKLKDGDIIITDDGRHVAIESLKKKQVKASKDTYPFIIPVGSLGFNYPPQRFEISPDHLIKTLDGKWIHPKKSGLFKQNTNYNMLTYYHIQLPNYKTDHLVVNNGCVVESFSNGDIQEYNLRQGIENNTVLKQNIKRNKITLPSCGQYQKTYKPVIIEV